MGNTPKANLWLAALLGSALVPATLAAPEPAPATAAPATSTAAGSSAQSCAPLERAQVAQWFDRWNLALASLDAEKVTERYWPDAVLLPTVSNLPRTTPALVHDYFEHFVAKHPRGRIDSRNVQLGCNTAIDMGTYTFSLMDDAGHVSEVAARYTFVYQYRNGEWRILHHHSSAMPEPVASMTAANNITAHATLQDAAPPAAPTHAEKPAVNAAAAAPTAAPVMAVHEAKPAPMPAKPSAASIADARHETVAGATKPAPTETTTAEPEKAAAGGTQMFLNAVASPKLADFYPPAAKPKNLKGSVGMRVCATPAGKLAGAPVILKSSGSADLDAAASAWARAARWVPATLDRKPVEGCTELEVPARS